MLNQVITSTKMICILSNPSTNAIVNLKIMSFTHESLISSLQYRYSISLLMSYSRLLINLSIGQWWIENSKLIRLLQWIRVANELELWENKIYWKIWNKNEFEFISCCVLLLFDDIVLLIEKKQIQLWQEEKVFWKKWKFWFFLKK